MKTKLVVFLTIAVVGLAFVGCTENARVKSFGGTMSIDLPPGTKFVNVTWKEVDLWYVVRPMRTNEVPETFEFIRKPDGLSFGGSGKVVFRESR